ncbi:MAG: alpha/beta hydrolase [Acidobacteriia bacterium]|nr:alpha/beta hydrolase [Terriglobia bacterium]
MRTVFALLLVLGMTGWGWTAGAQVVGAGAAQSPAPASQPKAQSAAAGEWQGALSRLRLAVKIDQVDDGSLRGTLTSLDQGNVTIPIEKVTLDPDHTFRFALPSIEASYEGKLSANGQEITGTWAQSGTSLALAFHRPGASAAKATLKPRTQGKVALEPCRTVDGNSEALCGKYELYENRQSRSGRKIALNIMVMPSTSEKPEADPFFALAGGPGQSAIEAFPIIGFITRVREHRDVVLVDQRGTGGSNPLQCELRNPKEAQTVVGEFYSLEKLRACRAELEKRADLTQYTTSIAMDDIDEVRQAMGYDKINVFGGSYGTRAALVYLRLHGEHVRTLALEAVVPPQYRIPITFAHTIQNSVDQLIDRCAADSDCHKDYPDLRKEFNTVLERLDKAPAQFEVNNRGVGRQQVTLSRAMFVASLRPMLYLPAIASQFPFMIHRLYLNNWEGYGTTFMNLINSIDKGLARGMSFSVVCAEDVPGLTEEEIRKGTSGTYLGDSLVHMYQQACREWKQASVPKDLYAPVRSNAPTLMISGALDPATPPETATEAARTLSNSRIVVIKDGTHGTGSPCIDGLIADFVEQGSVKNLDASCADQIHLPPFLTQSRVDQLQKQAAEKK